MTEVSTLIDAAIGELRQTTISGAKYFAKPGPGHWHTALANLDAAKAAVIPVSPPPPPPPPPPGQLTKVVDYVGGDFSQWDWGVQANGVNGYPAFDGYANRGTMKLLDNFQGVKKCCQMDLPAGDPSGKGLTHVACEGMHQRIAEGVAIGVTEFVGMQIYIPSQFTLPPVFWGCDIAQGNYAGFYGFPVGVSIWPNGSIGLVVNSGLYNSTTRAMAYYSGAPGDPPKGAGSGPLYLVPTSMFARDKWLQMIWKVKWAKDATGSVAAWARVRGDANWTNTVPEITKIPTLQVDGSGNPPGGAKSDKAGLYTYELDSPFRAYHANPLTKGTTFEAVAGYLF